MSLLSLYGLTQQACKKYDLPLPRWMSMAEQSAKFFHIGMDIFENNRPTLERIDRLRTDCRSSMIKRGERVQRVINELLLQGIIHTEAESIAAKEWVNEWIGFCRNDFLPSKIALKKYEDSAEQIVPTFWARYDEAKVFFEAAFKFLMDGCGLPVRHDDLFANPELEKAREKILNYFVRESTGKISGSEQRKVSESEQREIGKLVEYFSSLRHKVFFFLLDHRIIPHEKFEFDDERKRLLDLYRNYQKAPGRMADDEKKELVQLVEFFAFLRLDNEGVINCLCQALREGLDFEDGKIVLDEKIKRRMQADDVRWRILRALNWSPANGPEVIELMKAFVGSPVWDEKEYAILCLGRIAAHFYKTNQKEKGDEIFKYILDKKNEILKDPPLVYMAIVHALAGNYRTRQPCQRTYLSNCTLSIEGLKAIAQGGGEVPMDPFVRCSAVFILSVFDALSPNGKAGQALKELEESDPLFFHDLVSFSKTNKMPEIFSRIDIKPADMGKDPSIEPLQTTPSGERPIFPTYTTLKTGEWEFPGVTLGKRGQRILEVGIHNREYLALLKIAPNKPPRRNVIPAVEFLTSAFASALKLDSVSRVQLIQDPFQETKYFSYAVGQEAPLPLKAYNELTRIAGMEHGVSHGEVRTLEQAAQELLFYNTLGYHREVNLDEEGLREDPIFGKVLAQNPTGSTVAFLGKKKEKEAEVWFQMASDIFLNPQFLDQIKFLGWMFGNEDQSAYHNLMLVKKRGETMGKIFGIDFGNCFPFLQNKCLDWRQQFLQFRFNLSMASKLAPSVFFKNIKPLVTNYLDTSPKEFRNILDEIRYENLTSEDKNEILLLMMSVRELLEKEAVTRLKK